MSKIKIFCFGFGQVAESFLNKLLQEKVLFDASITSRNESHMISFNDLNINSFKFNNNQKDNDINKKIEEANYILVSIPPIDGEDIVIKNFSLILKNVKNCKWITYLSATSVYGDHKGNWVTETSPTRPTSFNGSSRLNAERQWLNFAHDNNLPVQIFRLAGIYSNEFNILKRLKDKSVQIVDKENHFFSRIHVEDIANILFKSLNQFKEKEIYNISDDRPASQREVANYGSKLLNIDQPKSVKEHELKNEMLKNFYKDSKKVDNKKMKHFFDYKLKYPSYIEGLNYIFNDKI